MKKLSSGLVALVFAAVLSHSAVAAPPAKTASGKSTFYMGLTLDNTVTGGALGVPAATALFFLNEKALLQLSLAMPTIQPFLMGGGGAYKYTVVGDAYKGFHIGGSLHAGAATAGAAGGQTFFISITPLFGAHVEAFENVYLGFDGGLNFLIKTATAANTFDMSFGGNSIILGITVAMGL